MTNKTDYLARWNKALIFLTILLVGFIAGVGWEGYSSHLIIDRLKTKINTQNKIILKQNTMIKGRDAALQRYHSLMMRAIEDIEKKDKELKHLKSGRNSA